MDDTDLPEEENFDVEGEEDEFSLYSPNKPWLSFVRQVYCCSCTILLPSFGAIMYMNLYFHYPLDDYIVSYMSGEVIGILFGGIFVSMFGRKLAIITSNFMFLLCLLVSHFTFYGEKTLSTPIVVGTLFQFSTMSFIFYTAEICNVTFRAFFMGFYYTTYYFAHYCMVDTLTYNVNKAFLVTGILAFFSSILSLIVPETPYYLALKGNLESAEDTFIWIRAGTANTVEYDLMLDKAQRNVGLKEIFSSTLVICVVMGILLKICNVNECELLYEMYYHLNSLKDFDVTDYKYQIVYYLFWWYYTGNLAIGGLMFSCISLVIPRKVIYGMGFTLTLLLLVPLVQASSPYDMILTLSPICSILSTGARLPLTLILPVEILPTIMRNVGLTAIFIFERMIQIYHFYTMENALAAFISKRVGRNWIFLTYSVSLIGIPFLLIFMPETMDTSIFELEEVTISIADIIPFRSTGLQDTEESVPE